MILLVVDMQKALTEDEELYDAEAFMDRNIRLIDAARKNNVEVIFVQHDAGEGSGFSAGMRTSKSIRGWRRRKAKRFL